jgi:predicted GNAT family acetyltransferase
VPKPTFVPLTADRWGDLVDLFGPDRGACAGCWCMWPRVRSVEFRDMAKAARRDTFRRIVQKGPPPGLLAYQDGLAVGWVAIGPRRDVLRFNISKNSAPLDAEAVDLELAWAITCFYVRNGHRGDGMMSALARAAIAYARRHKARTIEVCAIEPAGKLSWGEAFVGVASVFHPLGFAEIARRSPRRPLLQLVLGRPKGRSP